MYSTRSASEDDLDAVLELAGSRPPRRLEAIRTAVVSGDCAVACEGEDLVAFATLEYNFFDEGFVSLLWVKPHARRQGIGTGLMQALRERCATRRLFTSTNLSNRPMQALLQKLGYRLTGTVHDLDEGDPELLYVRD